MILLKIYLKKINDVNGKIVPYIRFKSYYISNRKKNKKPTPMFSKYKYLHRISINKIV